MEDAQSISTDCASLGSGQSLKYAWGGAINNQCRAPCTLVPVSFMNNNNNILKKTHTHKRGDTVEVELSPNIDTPSESYSEPCMNN